MATQFSILAWEIPWTEEPGGLQSMGSHRVGHDRSDLAAAAVAVSWFPGAQRWRSEKARATHSSILAWRIPGTGEAGGLPSMGSHRVGHD